MTLHIKILFTFLLLSSFSNIGFTQNREFAPIGTEWRYTWGTMSGTTEESFKSEKDTIIEGSKVKELSGIAYYFPRISTEKKDTYRITMYLKVQNDSIFLNKQFLYRTQPQINDSMDLSGNKGCIDFAKVDSIYSIKFGNESYRVARYTRTIPRFVGGSFITYPIKFVETLGLVNGYLSWGYSFCGPTDFPLLQSSCIKYKDMVFSSGNACFTTSPTENTKNLDFNISPNPIYDIMTLELPALEKSEFAIVNLLGQTLLTKNIDRNTQNYQLDVSDLPNGTYLICLKFDNQLLTKKIIVQH
jgi:hypothetical protein